MMAFPKNCIHIKRWRLQELVAIIDSIEDDIEAAIQRKRIVTEHDYCNLVLRATGKAVVSMREIICLVSCGYPDGALAIARNLFEQLIILEFFAEKQYDKEFDDLVQDYYLDYEIQRYKALIYEYKYCAQDSKTAEENQKQLQTIKERTHSKAKGTYWWAGHSSFSQLVDSVIAAQKEQNAKHLLHRLHVHYRRACVALHASCIGNTLRLGKDPEFAGIDTSPTKEGHGLVLWFATLSFGFIIGSVFSILESEDNSYVKELTELAAYYDDIEWGCMVNQ